MTTASGLNFFDDQFSGAALERVTQNLAVLNANSGGALVVQGGSPHQGRARTTTRFNTVSGLVQTRDPDSGTDTVTPTTFGNEAQKEIKVYRRVSHDWRWQDWLDMGFGSAAGAREASRQLGLDFGDQKVQGYINTGISAILGGLLKIEAGAGTVLYDYSGTGSLNYVALGQGLKLFGDRASAIRTWLMRGAQHADIFINAQGSQPTSFQVGDLMLVRGATPLINRGGVVTDSSALVKDNGSAADTYYTMGLQPAAVVIEETESEIRDIGTVKGTQTTAPANMLVRIDIQYAFTIKVMGCTYAGADNPSDATLATAAGWTQIADDVKNGPGILVLTT